MFVSYESGNDAAESCVIVTKVVRSSPRSSHASSFPPPAFRVMYKIKYTELKLQKGCRLTLFAFCHGGANCYWCSKINKLGRSDFCVGRDFHPQFEHPCLSSEGPTVSR
jgi:hypothetical protein